MSDPLPDTPKPGRKLGSLMMIWQATKHYPGHLAIALTALLTTTGATLSLTWILKLAVDRHAGTGEDHAFYILFALVGVLAIATAIRFYFVSWLGERTVADVRVAVQSNLLRLEPGWFEENRPSEIASRLTADTAQIEMAVGTTVSVALRNLLTGVGGVALLFYYDSALAGMLMIGIPIVVLPLVLLGRRVRGHSRSSQDRIADIGAMAVETLSAMKVVQAFSQERREADRFAGAVDRGFVAAKRRILIRALMTSMVIGLLFGGLALLLRTTLGAVSTGVISAGTLLAFVTTSVLVAGAFGALTEVYGDLLRAAGAAERLSELLDVQPQIAPPANPVALPQPPSGAIRFDHVAFRYPTRQDASALVDFSLDVKPGQTIAVVGPSGAGKTTLFQLLQRFYDPQGGVITIDGVPLTAADPAAVRRSIAMVPQETVIFGASARDNIRYGDWGASDKAIWAAAEAGNAAEFLRKLPDGLDTFMGEGGARLSGGQRQRMAIARALLRDAPILLLDEATSALDAESERLVQQALERLMDGRTTIVIAHRLATVRAAARIIVMDDGRIVEDGTHASLNARGGLYARLAALQFSEAA